MYHFKLIDGHISKLSNFNYKDFTYVNQYRYPKVSYFGLESFTQKRLKNLYIMKCLCGEYEYTGGDPCVCISCNRPENWVYYESYEPLTWRYIK